MRLASLCAHVGARPSVTVAYGGRRCAQVARRCTTLVMVSVVVVVVVMVVVVGSSVVRTAWVAVVVRSLARVVMITAVYVCLG